MKKQNIIFNNPIIKNVTKILSWILLAFLVLIAGLLIYNVISSKIYEIRGQKYEPEIALYTIISPSMEPNIKVYDVVVTKKIKDFSEIKEGDIITFISTSTLGEGLTVTHRVKSVINTEDDIKFRTQGDNNAIPDSSLASSKNVLGKVIFKVPWVGHIQFLLQSKGGWLFALLIPAMIVVIYDVYKVIRLSNVKQKVNDSIKEEVEDEKLTKKKDDLKKQLKDKYDTSLKEKEEKEDIVEKSDTKPNKLKNDKKKINNDELIETSKPEKVNEVIENNNINIENVMRNIKEIEKEQEEFDVNKIMKNIATLEEDNDFELPKTK